MWYFKKTKTKIQTKTTLPKYFYGLSIFLILSLSPLNERVQADSFFKNCSSFFSKKTTKIIPNIFLLGSVGGGFYLTSKVTDVIPPQYSYLSSIVTFASGMAVVAIGAPIFRKIMPIVDQKAFKISLLPQNPIQTPSQSLSEIWGSLNAHFDVNSQIAINQLTKLQDFISATSTRILAHPLANRQEYATKQFIWLATIWHQLFYYISPNDTTSIYSLSTMLDSESGIDFSLLKQHCLKYLSYIHPDQIPYYTLLLSNWFDPLIEQQTNHLSDVSTNSTHVDFDNFYTPPF